MQKMQLTERNIWLAAVTDAMSHLPISWLNADACYTAFLRIKKWLLSCPKKEAKAPLGHSERAHRVEHCICFGSWPRVPVANVLVKVSCLHRRANFNDQKVHSLSSTTKQMMNWLDKTREAWINLLLWTFLSCWWLILCPSCQCLG